MRIGTARCASCDVERPFRWTEPSDEAALSFVVLLAIGWVCWSSAQIDDAAGLRWTCADCHERVADFIEANATEDERRALLLAAGVDRG